MALPPSAQAASFVRVEARFPDPSLAVVKLGGLRLLVDSGCPQTLVRADKIGRDGTIALPGKGARLRPVRLPPAELSRPSEFLEADGILGNDALGRVAVLIDYEEQRVFMAPTRGATVTGALEAAMIARPVVSEVALKPDGEGWFRAASVGGDDATGAVWDTGASSYAFEGTRAELGPRLGFVDVQGFSEDSRRPIHLARVALPGAEAVPVLGFRRPPGDEPATIGPYALTRAWSYLDLGRGMAAVPRPDPAEQARRALASLLRVRRLPGRVLDRPVAETVGAIADVADADGLDRARRTALRIVRSRE